MSLKQNKCTCKISLISFYKAINIYQSQANSNILSTEFEIDSVAHFFRDNDDLLNYNNSNPKFCRLILYRVRIPFLLG